jgi:hypothetical protein
MIRYAFELLRNPFNTWNIQITQRLFFLIQKSATLGINNWVRRTWKCVQFRVFTKELPPYATNKKICVMRLVETWSQAQWLSPKFHRLSFVPRLCVLYYNFYWIFPLRSLGVSLISGARIAVVIMTVVVRWVGLALSKGPNRVGISPHTWGWKHI